LITYGEVKLGSGDWWIKCEPFVSARLKRVFPRAPQAAAEWLRISASAENTRELRWFLQRYPMAVDNKKELNRRANEHVDNETRLADLMAGHIAPPSIELAEPPREYQTFAAQMLDVRKGYLLADDLGLGKTVSAICGLVHTNGLPALVVCPAHLPRQWQKMINRFAPALRTHILKKGQVYDLAPRKRVRQADLLPNSIPDVIITSYHKLRGWAETLAGLIKFVVFDECQALRSPGTGIYRAADLVSARATWRMGLSATPIYNYGHEFHHVIDVLNPGGLGQYDEFIREWCSPLPNGKARINDTKQFGAYMRREGLMLRRTREEVKRELPELTKVIHDIDADEAALDDMKGNAVALARIVLGQAERYRGERMQAAGEFDAMMRQATGIAKAPYVIQFVDMLLDSGEPIVLYGWHRAVYAMWCEALAKHNPVMYSGSESPTQKDAAIEAFVAGRTKLLIMSLRSGAGVDGLQGTANTVVFGELDWSPGVHEQCVGRVHRDGQDSACTAYFLVAQAGSDPVIAEVLGVKREQIEGVRNPDGAMVERIETGENNIRRLAREFLQRRGHAQPEETSVTPISELVMA
jgi:SNF2 family DNA or RNA helicase